MSFDELKRKYGIPQTHFFKYPQICSFTSTTQNDSFTHPALTTLEHFITYHQKGRGQISLIYEKLVSNAK